VPENGEERKKGEGLALGGAERRERNGGGWWGEKETKLAHATFLGSRHALIIGSFPWYRCRRFFCPVL
jgi:hypothetical protein